MPFDKKIFAETLDKDALPASMGKCAAYVRKALQAAGINTLVHPVPAKNYNHFLLVWGFVALSSKGYAPKQGDIVVIQPDDQTGRGHLSQYGHIAGYDGKRWISDFIQRDMWGGPYRNDKLSYQIYRHP